MYSTWKNAEMKIDGSGVLCTDVQFSLNTFLDPLICAEDRHNVSFNAVNGIGGTVNLTYILTGQDFLKRYFTNEKSPVSGNFGGLYFTSGYLTSYNLNCGPNSPIIANAQINFFDALSGTYTKTYDRSTGTKVLNYCDVLLVDPSNDGRGGGIGNISGISNIQFSFESQVDPLYLAGDQMPAEVRFGRKELMAVLTTDVYSGDLPVTGKPAGIKVNFTHPELAGTVESFSVSGVLFKRDLETSIGDLLKSRLYIRQNYAENIPGITSVSDLSAAPQGSITINGTNLGGVQYVFFERRSASKITVISDTQLTVVVPDDVVSGNITVVTPGGEATVGLFTPTYPALTVDKLQTISGNISGTAFISGSNFYQVTDVRFSTTAPGLWTGSSGFSVINSTMIAAPIPVNTAWGPVLVMATGRGVSGQSVEKFVPIPTIYGFFSTSGLSGDAITISGQGFSGVTGVLFNNLPNVSPYTASFTITANTGIRVTVPTGNVRGIIKVLAQSGISVTTRDGFNPFVSLTGIVPLSGRTGTAITLLGHNMFPDIMYSLGNNSYAVTFAGNATGVFFRTQFVNPNFTGLTGLIPYGARSGIVGINYNSASTYSSSVIFKLTNEPPTITGIDPKSGTYSGYISILGTNLYDVSAVKLSGLGVITTISNPTPVTSALADAVSFRIPVNTPKITGDIYTVIVETTIGANATGNALLTILDAPIFSGFSGRLLGTSGALGDRIEVTGKNIYFTTKIYVPYTGLSGESGLAFIDSGSFNSTNSRVVFFVPKSARTGLSNIILYNGVDYASGANFKLINKPGISGFSPFSGEWGTGISISGSFLSNITGIGIGTGLNAQFSIITDTGINLIVPEGSETNYFTIYSLAGSSTSTGKLAIYTPLPEFSGFTPSRAYSGEQLILSGARLNTIDMIFFTGGSTQIGFDYRYFTKVGSSGINLLVPAGITSGQITIRSPRGLVTSSQFFEPGIVPQILNVNPIFAAHNQTISLSGTNLSGVTAVYFQSPVSGRFVLGLNRSNVGLTGISVSVPREISIGSILISGSGRMWGSSSQAFVPLPTISGFTNTGTISGSTIRITGINSYLINSGVLLLTGSGNLFNILSGNFTSDYFNVTGNHIVDPTSGHSIFVGTLNSITVDTGRLAIINNFYSGITGANSFLTSQISDKLSNIISTNIFYLQETAPQLY